MRQRLVPQGVLLGLVALAILLLVALAVILGLSRLLAAMGDGAGSRVLDYVGLACGALFVVDLILMILGQAVSAVAVDQETDAPEDHP